MRAARSLSRRLLLAGVGIAVATVLYAVSLQLDSSHQAVTAGVASSFVFVVLIDVLLLVQAGLVDRSRIRFFGKELARGATTFVYPDLVLDADIQATLSARNQQTVFRRPESPFTDLVTHRIDVPRAVAANDIQALLYVASEFDSTAERPNIMITDGELLADCDRSFISFGFSSNDCTHLYLHECRRPLFAVMEDGEGSEYLRLANGSEYRSTTERQCGILVRFSPDREEHPERRWILVAGVGPVGTTGAGWYLARHWPRLARRVPARRDFIAVISVGSYTDRMPRLEEVLVDDGE